MENPSSDSAARNQLMPEIRSHIYFGGLLLLGACIYASPISMLGKIAFNNETYSHIPLIPLVSLVLLAIHGRSIFAGSIGKPYSGFAVCTGGLFLYGIAVMLGEHLDRLLFRNRDLPNDYLSLCMTAVVAWVIGSFIAVYGTQAFKKARFALLFLVFTIPVPMFLLDEIIASLQYATAEASDIVFKLSGASYHRSGLVFEFSNVAVQVAEQCSGIRSSLSLFILSIVTGYLFLRTVSRRVILALAVFPITVVKNAFRIMAITFLADQVDARFLTSRWIHLSGGIPFFAAALTLFIPLVWMLRKSEARKASGTDSISKLTN
jgi:exosortase